MEISGKIIKKLELQSGTSAAGREWKKQDIIIEQFGEYAKEVCVTAFGDKALSSADKFNVGDTTNVLCNVESREFKGRYYTSIMGYFWANKNAGAHKELKTNGEFVTSDNSDDLPF